MAKKQSVEDSVSLFPFLSILACIIGILVLMITAIALGQIGRDTPSATQDEAAAQQAALEAQQRLEQYRAARQSIERDREQIPILRGSLAELKLLQARLEALRRQLAALEAQNKTVTDTHRRAQDELLRHQAELERLAPQIKQLEQQVPPLQTERDRLRAELAKRQAPPEEASVLVQPSGSGRDMNPTFVECAAASAVLHDGPTPVRIPTAQLAGSAPYLQLLEKVKNTDKGTLVFLIRPDGVGTYDTARHIARSNYVKNGKLAIGGQGKLDFTRFGKKP
jgi:uncharacterized protein YlxW (UPF0749 family)